MNKSKKMAKQMKKRKARAEEAKRRGELPALGAALSVAAPEHALVLTTQPADAPIPEMPAPLATVPRQKTEAVCRDCGKVLGTLPPVWYVRTAEGMTLCARQGSVSFRCTACGQLICSDHEDCRQNEALGRACAATRNTTRATQLRALEASGNVWDSGTQEERDAILERQPHAILWKSGTPADAGAFLEHLPRSLALYVAAPMVLPERSFDLSRVSFVAVDLPKLDALALATS